MKKKNGMKVALASTVMLLMASSAFAQKYKVAKVERTRILVDQKWDAQPALNIDKNGRIFAVECIIFQDDSFEISINDITQEKEQALLKKTADTEYRPRIENPCKQHTGRHSTYY